MPVLSYFSRSRWKDYTRWTLSFFSKWKKATLFLVYFLRAFLLKPPRVLAIEDWAVCMGKCTSAVSLPNQIEFWCRACVFLRRKKRGSSCLCNWRMGKGVEAQRLGDYGKMSLSCTFSSLISHLAILLDYITQFSLNMYSEFSKTNGPFFVFFVNHKVLYCIWLFCNKNTALHYWNPVIDSPRCIFCRMVCLYAVSCVWVSCGPLIDGLSVCLMKVRPLKCP